jgi:hypothetical protein
MSEAPKQPRDLQAEAVASVLNSQQDAAAQAAAARFNAEAMVGHVVEEARAYYLSQGFPVVMVEQAGGSSVLSLMRQRVRLVVNEDGIVVEAYLG